MEVRKQRVADGKILKSKDRRIFGKKPISREEGEIRTQDYLHYVHKKLDLRSLPEAHSEMRSEMERIKLEKKEKKPKAA